MDGRNYGKGEFFESMLGPLATFVDRIFVNEIINITAKMTKRIIEIICFKKLSRLVFMISRLLEMSTSSHVVARGMSHDLVRRFMDVQKQLIT